VLFPLLFLLPFSFVSTELFPRQVCQSALHTPVGVTIFFFVLALTFQVGDSFRLPHLPGVVLLPSPFYLSPVVFQDTPGGFSFHLAPRLILPLPPSLKTITFLSRTRTGVFFSLSPFAHRDFPVDGFSLYHGFSNTSSCIFCLACCCLFFPVGAPNGLSFPRGGRYFVPFFPPFRPFSPRLLQHRLHNNTLPLLLKSREISRIFFLGPSHCPCSCPAPFSRFTQVCYTTALAWSASPLIRTTFSSFL